MDAELTLETAKKKIRQKEAVREQNLQQHTAGRTVVEEVRQPPRRPQRQKRGLSNHYVPSHAPRDKKSPRLEVKATTSARAVGNLHTKVTNAQQRVLSATDAIEKGKTVTASTNSMESASLGSVSTDNETSWMTTLLRRKRDPTQTRSSTRAAMRPPLLYFFAVISNFYCRP